MLKNVAALTLALSFFFVFLSSLVLYIEPAEHVASWAEWSFFWLAKPQWDAMHLSMGALFCLAAAAHILLNIPALLGLLRTKAGTLVILTPELLLATAVVTFVFLGTLAGFPPMGQLAGLSAHIRDRQAETYGEPPFVGAERASLREFAARMGQDLDKTMSALEKRNIKVASADQSLRDIAKANGVAPGGVHEAARTAREASAQGAAALPKDPPPGLGRRRLSDICEEYGLKLEPLLAKLAAGGVTARPSWTLSEIAEASGLLPIDIYEAMRAEGPVARPHAPSQPSQPAQPAQPTPAPAGQTPGPAPAQAPQPGPATTPGQPGAPPGLQTPGQPAQPSEWRPGLERAPGATPPASIVPPPGLGKMTLGAFCREFDIPRDTALERLARRKITAFSDMTFEELALENGTTAEEIMRLATTP